MTQFYTPLPLGVLPTWVTPEWEHTSAMPFCGGADCWCHYQPERIERYMVGPIERGEIAIPAALDIYYCRQLIGAGGGRK